MGWRSIRSTVKVHVSITFIYAMVFISYDDSGEHVRSSLYCLIFFILERRKKSDFFLHFFKGLFSFTRAQRVLDYHMMRNWKIVKPAPAPERFKGNYSWNEPILVYFFYTHIFKYISAISIILFVNVSTTSNSPLLTLSSMGDFSVVRWYWYLKLHQTLFLYTHSLTLIFNKNRSESGPAWII